VTLDARSDGLSNCIEGLGDPSVDTRLQTYRTWGYQPTVDELEQEWIQNWMAYVEVTLLASTMYRAGYSLINVSPDLDLAAVASFTEGDLHVRADGSVDRQKGLSWYAEQLKLQGDKLGGAALFPVLDDGLDPREPLNIHRIERVVGWEVFDRSEITPVPDGRRGQPTYYMLSDVVSLTTAAGGSRELQPGDVIHTSRLYFHMGRGGLSRREQRNRQWWGLSVLELNRRARLAAERASEYLSSYIHKCSWLHYSFSELDELLQRKDAAGNNIGEAYLRRRMQALRQNASSFGIAVTDGGRDAYTNPSGAEIPKRNPDGLESIMESSGDLTKIASYKATEWARGAMLPESIAFSTTGDTGLRGGENGGDWQKFGGDVQAAQANEGTPLLNWMHLLVFAARQGPTKGMIPDDWTVDWKPLRIPTPMEIAVIAKAQAEADEVRIRSNVAESVEVRDQRLVRGDTDGPLRVEEEIGDQAAGVGPAQVGIATAVLEGGIAVSAGEATPEFYAAYLQSIDEPRFPAAKAASMAEAAQRKTPTALPADVPLVATTDNRDAEQGTAAAEQQEPDEVDLAWSTDPPPSDLRTPAQLSELVKVRTGADISTQKVIARLKKFGARRWNIGGPHYSEKEALRYLATENGMLAPPAPDEAVEAAE
jgi:hypothetical protein